MAIDIWPWAIDRAASSWAPNYTVIDLANPANESGIITDIEIRLTTNATTCKVATFYLDSWTTYVPRDVVSLWAVTAWAKRSFSGKSLSVEVWDFIWVYIDSEIERVNSWWAWVMYVLWDKTWESASYTLSSNSSMSIYWYWESISATWNFFTMF